MRHNQAEREEKNKQALLKKKNLEAAYKEVFASKAGEKVLNDIYSKANMWTTTFTGNSQTFFNEGKRDLGLYIMKRCNSADPNIMVNLMNDNLALQLSKDE